jgi:hypothetical protein
MAPTKLESGPRGVGIVLPVKMDGDLELGVAQIEEELNAAVRDGIDHCTFVDAQAESALDLTGASPS